MKDHTYFFRTAVDSSTVNPMKISHENVLVQCNVSLPHSLHGSNLWRKDLQTLTFFASSMWHKQLLQDSKLDCTTKTETCFLKAGEGIFLVKKVYFSVSHTQGNLYISTYLWTDFKKNSFIEVWFKHRPVHSPRLFWHQIIEETIAWWAIKGLCLTTQQVLWILAHCKVV